jgi:alkanesulfonate monooxygenase SsuD/methylene tetrahydromethanopterin reductase-like flavin-dependent oxidoreductase (luciferase family)
MRVGLILPLGDEPGPGVPATYAEICAMAQDVESGGLDSVWVYDHLLSAEGDGPVQGTWEAWTMLSALAAATRRVQLGTLVSCTTFRHPGVLAKMAHTVAEISGDRLILGLGAGWHEPEYAAFGFPFDHRVDRFAESIEITANLLRDGKATLHGRYYQVHEAPLLPVRPAGARVPLLVGCAGGERMMALTARWADAWNGAWFGTPGPKFHERRGNLFAACEAAGRDPGTIDVTVGMIMGESAPRVPVNADAVAEALGQWRDEGVAHIIGLPDPTNGDGVAALIEGVRRFRGR